MGRGNTTVDPSVAGIVGSAPEGLSSRAAVSAVGRVAVWGAIQFWAADGEAGTDGTGAGGEDWSAWDRLFSRKRFEEDACAISFFGPFVREGIPERPAFLIISKGLDRRLPQPGNHCQHRKPSFFLVSAVQQNGCWQLPFSIKTLLTWLWQRWEIDVAHREMKSGLGLGEKQCWNRPAAILSVQWSVWTYAILILAAYRTWGICSGPPTPRTLVARRQTLVLPNSLALLPHSSLGKFRISGQLVCILQQLAQKRCLADRLRQFLPGFCQNLKRETHLWRLPLHFFTSTLAPKSQSSGAFL
ncbi:MAG TPA: hypothetical protein VLX61_08695 [Anaerolineales bacterium]|nr:hypothetical protein [Anaerolineales bacterium]